MELREIIGKYCENCDTTYFSRAKHDFNTCPCWINSNYKTGGFIDGGREYIRTGGDGITVSINITQTDEELYQDWNTGADKYMWLKGNIGTPLSSEKDSKNENPVE